MLVASPLTGPHGDKAILAFVNNIMMYTNTPSQEGSEAFLDYYIKNMKTYWQQGVITGTPRAAVHRRPARVPEERQQGQGDQGVPAGRQDLRRAFRRSCSRRSAQVDGSQPLAQFTQTVLGGKTDAKAALTTLQQGLSTDREVVT